jgi:hypothetical protein
MRWKYSEIKLFSDAGLRLKTLICPTATPMAHIDDLFTWNDSASGVGAAIGCGG